MKRALITTLRNKKTPVEQFRQAADQLGAVLALECDNLLPKSALFVETPLAKTHGVGFKQLPILVPILRSGLVMLPPFLRFYPGSKIGFIGTRRDEETAKPTLYYRKLPPIEEEQPVLLLDPMIATGGSASMAVHVLKEAGILERQITLVSFIAAPEGVKAFQQACPHVGLIVAQVDEGLNAKKWIIPGLGDFGDRYFGT